MDRMTAGWEAGLTPFPRRRGPAPEQDALRAAGIALRPAEMRDLAELARLHALLRLPELLLAPWPPEQKLAFLNDQFRLQHDHYVKHAARADFWAIVDAQGGADGPVLGKLYLDRSRPMWRIIDILLTAELRGKGTGSALIGWAQRSAVEAGAQGIELAVMTNNQGAQALYRRLGFHDLPPTDPLQLPMRWTP
jgi:ribosomal protein S18 acetylase RimI-like enzyme